MVRVVAGAAAAGAGAAFALESLAAGGVALAGVAIGQAAGVGGHKVCFVFEKQSVPSRPLSRVGGTLAPFGSSNHRAAVGCDGAGIAFSDAYLDG